MAGKEGGGSAEITKLLLDWSKGNRVALDQLIPLVYDELRRLASRHMNGEVPNHLLQTTALLHEAYLRLVDQQAVAWQNRAHFFGICARLMRQILVDHARSRGRLKRGGGVRAIELDEAVAMDPARSEEVLAIHDALEKLSAVDARKAQVAELRFFGGLSVEEAAEVLQVSPNTVIRDWSLAKAWLAREMGASRG